METRIDTSDLEIVEFEAKGLVAVCEACPERSYCEFKIPDDVGAVQAIEFVIASRDQGWADDGGTKEDPYRNSFTYFVVGVRRRLDRYNVAYNFLLLQHNVTAKPKFTTHSITWMNTKDPKVSSNETAFLNALVAGDIIQILPKACFLNWTNYVSNIGIKLFYIPAEADAVLPSSPQMASSTIKLSHKPKVYTPLDESLKEIRLLKVLPSGDFESEIRCQLIKTALSDPSHEPYDTLSYCWGEPTKFSTLTLTDENDNSHLVNVTPSAVEALRYFRQADKVLTIWVDAICINQDDTDERAKQIGFMDNIYQQAGVVHVWLGGSQKNTETALKIFRDGYNRFNGTCEGKSACKCAHTPHTMTPEDHRQWLPAGDERPGDKMTAISSFHLQNVETPKWYGKSFLGVSSEFFKLPWFRRIWVIQEVLNAKEALVHCGFTCVPWKEIIEINAFMVGSERGCSIPSLEPLTRLPSIWSYLRRNFRHLPAAAHEPSLEKQPPSITGSALYREASILEVFLYALEMNASDIRDKLFAILSLGKETRAVASLPQSLLPNYDKLPDQVFADFTRWWMITNQSLSILSTIHGQPGRTWQDLSSLAGERPLSNDNLAQFPSWTVRPEGRHVWARATLTSQFRFSASADTVPSMELLSLSNEPLKLRLRGYALCKIIEKSQFIYDIEEGGLRTIAQVYETIFDPCLRLSTWIVPRDESPEIFRMHNVLKYNCHVASHTQGPDQLTSETYKPAIDPRRLNARPPMLPIERKLDENALPCQAECYFVAENGMRGLCPASAREGDMIAIMLGSDVPFLLRKKKDVHVADKNSGEEAPTLQTDNLHMNGLVYQGEWHLVGECFLGRHNAEGYMHGAFIEEMRFAGQEPDIFTLV